MIKMPQWGFGLESREMPYVMAEPQVAPYDPYRGIPDTFHRDSIAIVENVPLSDKKVLGIDPFEPPMEILDELEKSIIGSTVPGEVEFPEPPELDVCDPGGYKGDPPEPDAAESEKAWLESDYPFYPRWHRGGGRRFLSYLRRWARPKPFLFKSLIENTCPHCGQTTLTGFCITCNMQVFCQYCQQPVREGKCTNEACLSLIKPKCPECGEVQPCNCGLEQ